MTIEPFRDATSEINPERRFGGLSRLYGPQALVRLRGAHVAVVGLGGVGSWAVEALARSGIGALTLIDLDHIAESNVNRQIHALTDTLGQSKVEAMAIRIGAINPECVVTRVDDFVSPDNVGQVLNGDYAAILDCTDQVAAKIAMVLHARVRATPLLLCGGAGGKTDPLRLRTGDLSEAINDALLSKLRSRLRREHGFSRPAHQAGRASPRVPKMGVSALWFDQPPIPPLVSTQTCDENDGRGPRIPSPAPRGLSCAGYGSVVTVTAAMGLAAANEAIKRMFAVPEKGQPMGKG
jgi:tRNA A37 threonylcarbamoyladenosine dehydratase